MSNTVEKKLRIPGLSGEDSNTLNRLLAQLRDKQPRNILRGSYYDGKRAVSQIGSVVPPHYYRMGHVLGWSAKAVDTLAQRCSLEGFTWADGSLADLGEVEVWDGNRFSSESASSFTSSLVHAVSFLEVTKGGAGEPPALIHGQNATNATGDWNPRTRRLDSFLAVRKWAAPGEYHQGEPVDFTLYLPGRTLSARRSGNTWSTDWNEHSFHVPVEPLMYSPRTGREWGRSRITRPVMSIQDMALRTVIRMEGHLDVYSFPEMWMLGADPSIFTDESGQIQPTWKVMLGRIKGIPDDESAAVPRADVKQFPAASPEPHLLALRQQAQLFSGETSIPLTSLGVSDMSNPTSADSYIASREDLIASAERATDDWSPSVTRAYRLALAMANGLSSVPDEWATMAPRWRSPAHLSRTSAADAGSKQLGAVPWLAETEVGLELLGLDDGQIKRALAEKRRLTGASTLRERLAQSAAEARTDPRVDELASRGTGADGQ